jgi:hypothetical protein
LTQVSPSEGSLALAFRPQGDTASDIIIIASALTTVGSSPITSADCDSISCTGFVALFADGNMCALGAGTVALTQATTKRLSGTFAGNGTCFDLADTSALSDSVSFVVSNGSFNVPIMESLPGGEIRAGSSVRGLDAALRMRRRHSYP